MAGPIGTPRAFDRDSSPGVYDVETPTGFLGLWDTALAGALEAGDSAPDEARRSLRERARNGDVFFLDTEDPKTRRLEVVVGAELPEGGRGHFATGAGAFRLRAPSGELRLGSLPPEEGAQTIRVDAGDYVVTPYLYEFDPRHHRAEMVARVGEEDWAFHERATRIGALGCLSIVVGALLIALPVTRPLWIWWVLIFSLPTLTYSALEKTPRMRRIDAAMKEISPKQPDLVLLLRPADAVARELVGGWLDSP